MDSVYKIKPSKLYNNYTLLVDSFLYDSIYRCLIYYRYKSDGYKLLCIVCSTFKQGSSLLCNVYQLLWWCVLITPQTLVITMLYDNFNVCGKIHACTLKLQKLSGQLCKQWSDVAMFVVVLGRSNAMHLIGWSKGKLCNGLVKGGVLSPITDICDMFKLDRRD